MLTDGQNVTIREGEVEQASCRCCDGDTTIVHGTLMVEDMTAGWYTVAVTLGAGAHLPALNLYIGDWTETAGPDERWGLRVAINAEGPFLRDWSEADQAEARPVFTPLMPDQVHGTPMEPQIWALIDRILTQDSRL